MKLLLDTHLLLWTSVASEDIRSNGSLSGEARDLIEDEGNELLFSAASVWEVAIKNALGRPDFKVDPHLFRRALLDNGYIELTISSAHTAAVANLPDHHKDPFDRLLVAQATVEGITLLTNDETVAAYTASPIRLVK
ncbi:type II toxin-antitoxin system VapC family toxin [Paraburkholderia sartisoli]|uniref:PIN domain nuclease, a component of toxin-antitoxin system (PIN domain) n=1 Tax=Paraburkholderia sartisoli TaxID=83784 RepID=A0A1H4H8C4_9BURK|nr:type II toxin-antitoxin system VapC family toxin [Paraburkholderia sartisoli]SEB17956.1 PIN domain nuclease, a component of toxin-antitoxin system (PIN domain) [Paraburkholderia sartisoli]